MRETSHAQNGVRMNSFIQWIGGKKLLRKQITELFPEKINKYVEVFGGAGWVLFHKERHAPFEVYNDMDGQLVNLFRCVKYHPEELSREISGFLNARELFQDTLAQIGTRGFTDIQRAARFYILIKASYGGKRGTFSYVSHNIQPDLENLKRIQERLKSVIIDNQDFEKVIAHYDSPETLFYLDPPYFGTEKYYSASFSQEDHQRLYHSLCQIQGKFVLSYNDHPYIKELYQDFVLIETERKNNLAARYSDAEKSYKELILKNF